MQHPNKTIPKNINSKPFYSMYYQPQSKYYSESRSARLAQRPRWHKIQVIRVTIISKGLVWYKLYQLAIQLSYLAIYHFIYYVPIRRRTADDNNTMLELPPGVLKALELETQQPATCNKQQQLTLLERRTAKEASFI